MALPERLEVGAQGGGEGRGQDSQAIAAALAAAQADLAPVQVEILDAKLEALSQAQPRAVEQRRGDLRGARHRAEQSPDLVATQGGTVLRRARGGDL